MRSRILASSFAIIALSLGAAACVTAPTQSDSAGLAGTAWSVEAVNGQGTLPRTDFTMTFTGSTFDARLGCRRATGNYAVSYTLNGNARPVFRGSNVRITGTACTGKFAEQLGPELLANASFTLDRQTDGRLMLAQPPTFILLRPLRR